MTNQLKAQFMQNAEALNAQKKVESTATETTKNEAVSAEQAAQPQAVKHTARRVFQAPVSEGKWYMNVEGVSTELNLVNSTRTGSTYEILNGTTGVELFTIYAPTEKQFEYNVVATLQVHYPGVDLKSIQVLEYEDGNLSLRPPSRKDEATGKYYDHFVFSTEAKAQLLAAVEQLLSPVE